MKTAGYSSTPLARKLGIKHGNTLRLIGVPAHYFDLFADFPEGTSRPDSGPVDFIHFFTDRAAELEQLLPELKAQIHPNGMIWVSWPKKASGVPTDISENLIRDTALAIGLVDVKVCAVDDVWSGLKLVIPVSLRPRT